MSQKEVKQLNSNQIPDQRSTSDTNKDQYDEESKAAIKEVFYKFDKDGSGDIQYEEIGKLAKELGFNIKTEDIQQIFKDLDSNGDKKISFEEFWEWWSSGKPNKLEKLVYYKLKGMKLLKKAHSEFTRMGASIESKYDKSIDTHYAAINYGSSKGDFSAHVNFYLQNESNQSVRESAFLGVNLKNDTPQNAFGIVMRMKSKNAKEGRRVLQNLLIDVKRIIGLLNGPQMGKLIEPFEFEIFEVKDEEISTIEKIIRQDIIKGLYQLGEKSNANLEMHFGVKNSLKKILQEPNLKFVNWLFEGFLLEAKLTMNRDLLSLLRKLIIATVALKNVDNPKKQKNIQFISIMTLLSSSKFHLTFKDMDNIKKFFEGLGLAQLSEEAPSCFELFKEIFQDIALDKIIQEDSPYPFLKGIINFLNKFIIAKDFNIFLCFDIAVAQICFQAEGLGEIIQKIFEQNNVV